MTIAALIDKTDTFEVVRDTISAILLAEVISQKALATAASKDPAPWDLRVYLERANPWAEFEHAPTQIAATPIVNVALDNLGFDPSSSNLIEAQKATAVFNVDCYGYGISEDLPAGGHTPGDSRAALEVQRVVRLVRNILMSADYAYLGLRGTVFRRWVQSVQIFQPQMDARPVQHVVGARIAFQTEFGELSPQVTGEPLELVASQVLRRETGEVYFAADYDASAWP